MTSNYAGQDRRYIGDQNSAEFTEALRRRAINALNDQEENGSDIISELSSLALSQLERGLDPHTSTEFLLRFVIKNNAPLAKAVTIRDVFPEFTNIRPELYPALVVAGSMALNVAQTEPALRLDPYHDSPHSFTIDAQTAMAERLHNGG